MASKTKPNSAESDLTKAGRILAMIGGWLGVAGGLALTGITIFLAYALAMPKEGGGVQEDVTFFVVFFVIFTVYILITSILTLVGARWMRKPETLLRGSVMVLVCGLMGGSSLFGMIGGILGLIDYGKKGEQKRKR